MVLVVCILLVILPVAMAADVTLSFGTPDTVNKKIPINMQLAPGVIVSGIEFRLVPEKITFPSAPNNFGTGGSADASRVDVNLYSSTNSPNTVSSVIVVSVGGRTISTSGLLTNLPYISGTDATYLAGSLKVTGVGTTTLSSTFASPTSVSLSSTPPLTCPVCTALQACDTSIGQCVDCQGNSCASFSLNQYSCVGVGDSYLQQCLEHTNLYCGKRFKVINANCRNTPETPTCMLNNVVQSKCVCTASSCTDGKTCDATTGLCIATTPASKCEFTDDGTGTKSKCTFLNQMDQAYTEHKGEFQSGTPQPWTSALISRISGIFKSWFS